MDLLTLSRPNGPGPPPEPPGLPSVRGSQRDSADDVSTAAYTAEEVPRMSRREADKVYVSPWPKQQNLGVWQSDLIKSVVLAANDGDKAAWEAWLQPAIRPNPDIELLNDSGGQRYQSIDAKLSIALSNVIAQAGDVARHVVIKLRLRTQSHSRRGTYVMGREILAMILEHFRTPGQRETAFTMEHIVSMKYLGDSNLEVFYEKWMEMVSNMMPDDVPPDDWLRDALYKKIRNSSLMMFDIKQYESWMEGDQRRSYRYLLDVIERHISRIREDKHVAAREKYARDFAGGGKPSAPAPNPTAAAPDANPKAKPKATLPRRRQHPRRRPRPMQLRFYHLLSLSSMQKGREKVKGKERIEQTAEVPVQDPRRKSRVISISSRKHAERAKIASTVTTKRCSTQTRTLKATVESQELQEVNLLQTKPRRLMSRAGIGPRASVGMETSATNATILIYSTLLQTLRHQAQRLHLHLSMIGVMMKGRSTRLHRT